MINYISNTSNETVWPNRTEIFQNAYTSFSQLLLESLVFAVIQIFGLAGNLLVIISVLNERRLQTNYYVTVLQLSICDTGLLAASITAWQIFPWIWYNGHVLRHMGLICKLWSTGISWFYTNGVYLMVLIGYLRYRSVVMPFKERLSRKWMLSTIALLYLISTLFFAPRFISIDEDNFGRCYDTYLGIFLYDLYSYSLPVIQFLFPVIFLTFLYAKLCFSLHKHSKNIQSRNPARNGQDATNSRLEFALQRRNKKAVLTGVIIVAVFAVSNIPIQTTQIHMTYVNRYYDLGQAFWTSLVFYIGSACINPYVYALLDDAIFASFKKRLKTFCCRNAGM
jgi:hypothetical protein